MIRIAPDCALAPNKIDCGPGNDSMRATSTVLGSTACVAEVMGMSPRKTADDESMRHSPVPVLTPRNTTSFLPGDVVTVERLGMALTYWAILSRPSFSICSVLNAWMLCGTSCRFISRFVAVTMTSSITPALSWASAMAPTLMVATAIATACASGVLAPIGVMVESLLKHLSSRICRFPDQDDVAHGAATGALWSANTVTGDAVGSMDVATD